MRDQKPFSAEDKSLILGSFFPRKLWKREGWDCQKVYLIEKQRNGNSFQAPVVYDQNLHPKNDFAENLIQVMREFQATGGLLYPGCCRLLEDSTTKREIVIFQVSEALPASVSNAFKHFHLLEESGSIHVLRNSIIDSADNAQTTLVELLGRLNALEKNARKYVKIRRDLEKIDAERILLPSIGHQPVESRENLIFNYFEGSRQSSPSELLEFSEGFTYLLERPGKNSTRNSILVPINRALKSILSILAHQRKMDHAPSKSMENVLIEGLVAIFDSFAFPFRMDYGDRYQIQRWKFAQTCFDLLFNDEDERTYKVDTWRRKVKKIPLPSCFAPNYFVE